MEWGHFLLMKKMRWSWAELCETPLYIRRFTMDFLGLISEAEEREQKKAKKKKK